MSYVGTRRPEKTEKCVLGNISVFEKNNTTLEECAKALINGRILKIQRQCVKVQALSQPSLIYLVLEPFLSLC
jgi:hypothetical protein